METELTKTDAKILRVVNLIELHLEDMQRVFDGKYGEETEKIKDSVREPTNLEGLLDELCHRLEAADRQIVEHRDRLRKAIDRMI